MVHNADRGSDEPPYRVRAVARRFGVTEKTVRDGIAAKRIPAFRLGRLWLVPREWVNSQGTAMTENEER
jgi:excisionase family DNA binding protein